MNKDKIELAIVSEIKEHKSEIFRLERVLEVYKNSLGGTVDVDATSTDIPEKRKYVKSGKYAKKKTTKRRKRLSGDLKIVKWKKLIVDVLQGQGEPMTSKQIITRLFSGRHKSTLKVLKRKISVALTIYKNDGTLKTDRNGRGCKYGLPDMF